MKFTKTFQLYACVAAAVLITACSQTPKPIASEPALDPAVAGEKLMRSMSDTLAKAKSFSFDTSEQLEVIAPSGEKRVIHFARKVTVRRPNGLYFELLGKDEAPLQIAAYYDGRTVSLSEKANGEWTQTTVPGTLDEMLDDVMKRFGLPVPIGDVIYSSPYDAFISEGTKGGLVGQETIDGVLCHKLEYADDQVQVRVWLPTVGQPLPRRTELVYKKAPSPLTTQLNFANWNLDATVSDATFAFQKPAGKAPDAFDDFTKGLFKRVVPSAPLAASNAAPGARSADALKVQ